VVAEGSRRELEAIARLSRSLLEATDLGEQLGLSIRLAADALDADRGSIMLVDLESGELEITYAEGPPEEMVGQTVPRGDGIAGWVALHNEPVVVHGEVEDPRFEGVNPSLKSALSIPMFSNGIVLGVLNLVRESGERFEEEDLRFATSLTDMASVAIEKASLYARLRDREARMSRLLEAAIGAQEQERRRIAAEIHDGFLQDLSGMFLKIERTRSLLQRGQVDEAIEITEGVQNDIRDQVKGIRDFIFEVRPPSLDQIGLAPTMEAMLNRVASDNGLKGYFSSDLGPDRLVESIETILYRTAQEALRNVIKHAGATEVYVKLDRKDSRVILEIEDNGVGFDTSTKKKGHFGMDTMRERIELAGGDFHVMPRPGRGTILSAILPLE
jgi:two-component system NarL family sensor kinase